MPKMQLIATPGPDEETKAECERLFQNGGPKVYFQDGPGGPLRPSHASASKSVRIADDGQAVFARLKNRRTGVYDWRKLAATGEAAKVARTPDSWPTNGRRPIAMPADVMVGEGPAAYRARKAAASKGLTFTAADMGRAVFASDTWPPRPGAGRSPAAASDICSYITRVLFGRNLMLGRGPIRVNLENGHHLTITMEKDEV